MHRLSVILSFLIFIIISFSHACFTEVIFVQVSRFNLFLDLFVFLDLLWSEMFTSGGGERERRDGGVRGWRKERNSEREKKEGRKEVIQVREEEGER